MYSFTPSPTANPDRVKQLELDLVNMKPTPKKRRRTQRSLQDYGCSNLALSRSEPYQGDDPYVVRIYYKSMGGEVLCCDSEIMSRSKAENLYNQHRDHRRAWFKGGSDAIGALLLPVKNGKPVRPIKSGMRDARLVTFPSQMTNQIEIFYDEAKAA